MNVAKGTMIGPVLATTIEAVLVGALVRVGTDRESYNRCLHHREQVQALRVHSTKAPQPLEEFFLRSWSVSVPFVSQRGRGAMGSLTFRWRT